MLELNQVKNSIASLEKDLNSLEGQINLLNKQLEDSNSQLANLKDLQIKNAKFVELLHLVKKITQDNIKSLFEKVVTQALQYIHQDNDYKFALEFSRRGQLPELKFLIKTPEMQEAHDILDTRGGGSCDIVSLALRFVLLEISKMPGFLFLDEPFKHLDSLETIQKGIEFVKEMQKETNRQIFIITHKQEVVDSVSNPIVIKKKMSTSNKCPVDNGQLEKVDNLPKKTRGRPKGKKNV
jgi:DNA repair exonuclease SbcCD ATPase subunit